MSKIVVLQERMTSTDISFAGLSDHQLIEQVKRLAATERRAIAALVRALMELDARRLYLGEGYSSLFTYCTQVLHLAEGAAYNRIEAARAARRFPPIIEALEDGSLTLTAVRRLGPHLTADNCQGVLAAARHKSKLDIERLVASLKPKPAVPSVIRKLREQPTPGVQSPPPVPQAPVAPAPRPTIVPLAPERYKVQLTISCETHEKLRRVQALVRHTIPNADLGEIVDRALTLLLNELERRRCAATPSPRGSRAATCPPQPWRRRTDGSRHIPAAVKREVWRRDDGRCAFVGRNGRCTERAFLEFHHVQPYAAGGAATAANIQLRCRPHNGYEASLFFGSDAPEFVREVRALYGSRSRRSACGPAQSKALRFSGGESEHLKPTVRERTTFVPQTTILPTNRRAAVSRFHRAGGQPPLCAAHALNGASSSCVIADV